ncbi:MAG: DEAD/DEAH box helicase [Thermodesulfobacteriota bacterium]
MNFSTFDLHPQLVAALTDCGYVTPTPIQQQAIGPLKAGRDLLGLAQTGTGKTAAFVLPLLHRLLDGPRRQVRALILAPTRELAEQIHGYIGKLAAGTDLASVVVYGGVSKNNQIRALQKGVEIVVACPGRLLDLMNDRAVRLDRLEILVLDEADHMFDKGFLPDIRRILRALPAKRQNMIFSATMPAEIRHLAENILTEPVTVQIDHTKPAATISHVLYRVEQKDKTALLRNLLQQGGEATTLVFTRTKHKAKNLAVQLQREGFKAVALQGNLSQAKRQQAMDGFRDGTFSILVATDIAARGIDVSGIAHVINYDVPDTAETYTHRTGRTGRASRSGEACTFATAEDHRMIVLIERGLGRKMAVGGVTLAAAPVLPEMPVARPLRRPEPGNREQAGNRGRRRPAPAAAERGQTVAPRPARRSEGRRAASFDFGLREKGGK